MPKVSGVGNSADIAKVVELMRPEWIETAPLVEVFLALNVLHERRPQVVTGVMLGGAVRRLIGCETKPGGPYASETGVVDPVANACIAVFVQWAGKPLPELSAFLDGHYDTAALTTADAPFRGKKAALSPLAAELLALHAAGHASERSGVTAQKHAAGRVLAEAERVIAHVPTEVRRYSLDLLHTFDRGDDNCEIRLLSAFFAKALIDAPKEADSSFCRLLGAANVHTWLAYTIYDDFYDDEAQPHLLPSANVSMRLAQRIYLEAMVRPEHRQFVGEVFDRVDAANAWEVTNCRFVIDGERIVIKDLPDLGNWGYIADRAYFHALGPMAVVARCGILPGDSRWQAIWSGFGHFLVARQCNDDLLDWRADLQAGHATPVVLSLLRHLGAGKGAHTFASLMPQAQYVFLRDVVPEICEQALERMAQTRQDFIRSGLLKVGKTGRLKRGAFARLLECVEGSLRDALAARKQGQEFLSAFKEPHATMGK